MGNSFNTNKPFLYLGNQNELTAAKTKKLLSYRIACVVQPMFSYRLIG
jgi:hypothetical protein